MRKLVGLLKECVGGAEISVNKLTAELAKVRPGLPPAAAKPVVYPAIQQRPVRTIPQHTVAPVPDTAEFLPSKSQQKILNVLAWLESIDLSPANKNQLAFLSDQSATSSGYTNNLGALRSAGLIDYPQVGLVALTDRGHAAAVTPDKPVTTDELHRQIQAKVSSSQWKILQALIEFYPEPISKIELADRADQSPTSSGYTNNLGTLRTLGLIDYPSIGMVVALKTLFV